MAEIRAVEVDDVSFSYDGRTVIRHATTHVNMREFTAIVGPNGSGKSTLLKLIAGLLEPASGTVRVFGTAPSKNPLQIGYVPQSFQFDPNFPVTVLDVVLMGRLGKSSPLGPYLSSDRADAHTHLAEVGIANLAHRHFGSLSGGQRQRALIARALVSHPELLLLDEPTASLDAVSERELYKLLEELNRELTIVMVTHDFSFVQRGVSTALCVHEGHIHRHPTSALSDVSGELLREIYGTDRRFVRHDRDINDGGGRTDE